METRRRRAADEKEHLIIFDLDGTLVDSYRDIAASVNEFLEKRGKEPLPPGRIYGFIGRGVRKLLDRALGGLASEEELDRAIGQFLPIYRNHLLDTTRPFPGVMEALARLEKSNHLAVLTNKPRVEAVAILDGLTMSRFFRWIFGGESFPRRKPDPAGVNALIDLAGASRDRTLLVGDSGVDFETARNAAVAFCLVSYGRETEALRKLNPDYLVDRLDELPALLTRQR